jgi:hypothetical protein
MTRPQNNPLALFNIIWEMIGAKLKPMARQPCGLCLTHFEEEKKKQKLKTVICESHQ